MPQETTTLVIKTCPACAHPRLSILRPTAEAFCGHHAVAGPLKLKVMRGLPVQVAVKCPVCQTGSTWRLVQTDPLTRIIDYVEAT